MTGGPAQFSTVMIGIISMIAVDAVTAQLTYVDKSTGLNLPAMEGGDSEIEIGDVNGDGHVDLVSIGDHGSPFINTQEHGIMVWLGDGLGNWAVVQSGDFGYGGVALGDVNGDGFMDAGYAMHHNYSADDFGDQLIEVALGDGTAVNWTPWDDGLAVNGEDYGMFATDFADVDNDGDLDLGAISFGCCSGVHIYLNHADGTWAQSYGFNGGNSTDLFFFADFNGDGLADFACGHGSGNGTTYLGDGLGGFTPADGDLPGAGNLGRDGLSVGDVTGDGRDELAYVKSGAIKVWTWLEDDDWLDISGNLPITTYDQTSVADMNLDGHGDIVAHNSANPSKIVVYAGDGLGSGNWTQIADVPGPATSGTTSIRAGTDLDHNGYPDIVVMAEENVGDRNRPRAYMESSLPTHLAIFPSAPTGGQVFHEGSVQFLEWHGGVPNQVPASVTLEYSTEGTDGPWNMIVDGVPNNGRFQWSIPKPLPTSEDCRIRYTLSTKTDSVTVTSLNAFTIVGTARPPTCGGDANGDGTVDPLDSGHVLSRFGCEVGTGDLECDSADANLDGTVDPLDVGYVLSRLGQC